MQHCIFDEVIDRRNSRCRKWDNVEEVFGTHDILPLWIADMDFAAPPGVVDAINRAARHRIYGYHTRPQSFYQAAVDWVGRRHGWQVKLEWVINAPGVVPSIIAAILALTDPGDEVIIQPPVYPPFFSCVTKNGRQLVENPLRCADGRYEMDFDDLERKISSKTRMLILCSPHNPVGRVWTQAELTRLNEICLQHDIMVLADEIHSDLVFKGHKHIPVAALHDDAQRNTVTCISPSKTFNIAGFYTSYVIIADQSKRKKFLRVLEALEISQGNSFGVIAAEAAYRTGEGWLEDLLPYLEANADFMADYIAENIPGISMSKPEGTYLGWLDCRRLTIDSRDLKEFFVRKAKVGLNDGRTFGVQGEGFVRLNFGCPRSTLAEGLERIRQAVR